MSSRVAELEEAHRHLNSQLGDANAAKERIDELEQAQMTLNEQLSEMEAIKQASTDQVCQLKQSGTDLEGQLQLKTERIAVLEAEKIAQNDQERVDINLYTSIYFFCI